MSIFVALERSTDRYIIRKDLGFGVVLKSRNRVNVAYCLPTSICLKASFETKNSLRIFTVIKNPYGEGWWNRLRLRAMLCLETSVERALARVAQ